MNKENQYKHHIGQKKNKKAIITSHEVDRVLSGTIQSGLASVYQ